MSKYLVFSYLITNFKIHVNGHNISNVPKQGSPGLTFSQCKQLFTQKSIIQGRKDAGERV